MSLLALHSSLNGMTYVTPLYTFAEAGSSVSHKALEPRSAGTCLNQICFAHPYDCSDFQIQALAWR
jgi:hypothetical protein